MKRLHAFLKRRFARGEYLGLHLTVGLLVSLVILGLFVVIVRGIRKDHGELERIDHAVAEGMEEHASEHPLVLGTFRAVTMAGGFVAITALTLAGAVVLIMYRRRLEAIVWLVAVLGAGLLEALLKTSIARHRPLNRDISVHSVSASFPSGHSLNSVVCYGLLAYLVLIRLRHRGARVAVASGLGVWVLAIGFSRIYIRAHFLWDVVGGFCVGAVWLAFCVSGLEAVRLHRRSFQRSATSGTTALAGPPAER